MVFGASGSYLAEILDQTESSAVISGDLENNPDQPWVNSFTGPQGISTRDVITPTIPLVPNPGDTLLWDNGQAWLTSYYFYGGNGWGVEFEPYYYPTRITSMMIWFREGWPDPGGDDLILLIVDDDGPDGSPGTTISADTLYDVAEMGVWNEFAVNDTGVVIDDGIFYGFYIQMEDAPNCPAAGFDQGYDVNHGWRFYEGAYAPNTTCGDMLLRAVVERAGGDAHDVSVKSIIEPGKEYDPYVPIQPQAIVKNFGTFEESFDVTCRMESEGEVVYYETVGVFNLGSDESELVQFPQWTAEEGNVYLAEFRTLLYTDETTFNDTKNTLTRNYTVERDRVLLEGATGTWCYYCQYAAQALDSLREIRGDTVAIIEYHYSDDFATGASVSRIDYYNISSYPTIVFDGTDRVIGGSIYIYNSYRLKTNSELEKNVPVEMSFGGYYDSQQREGYVQIGIDAVNGIAAEDLRIHTVLTESHIAFEWFDEDSLQFVMREMFPDSSGIPVSLGKGDFVQELLFFQVSQDYVDENCEIVVFLQDNVSKEVFGVFTSELTDLSSDSELFVSAVPDTTHYHKGENLGYSITVINNTDSTVSAQGWTEAETPWGSVISPLLGPVPLSLSAHQSIDTHLSQFIPAYSPYGGLYTYRVKLGTYPDAIIAEDHFGFYVDTPDIVIDAVPDTTHVHRGELLGFTATVTNDEDSTVHLQAWAEAETPWGVVISPLVGPVDLNLNGGQSISPHLNQPIPSIAPYGGPFTYRVRVGLHPATVFSEDSFEFFIVPELKGR
jgi:hypothetical protein